MASAAPRSRVRRFVVGAIKTFVYLALLGGLALGVAVAVAVNQLPSFAELQRRANLGQMIRVRADDGTVIQTQIGNLVTQRLSQLPF